MRKGNITLLRIRFEKGEVPVYDVSAQPPLTTPTVSYFWKLS